MTAEAAAAKKRMKLLGSHELLLEIQRYTSLSGRSREVDALIEALGREPII